MSDIVKQCCQAETSITVLDGVYLIVRESKTTTISQVFANHVFENTSCDMHRAQAMFEPRVSGSRKHKMQDVVLLYVSEPLAQGMIKHDLLMTEELNASVDWVHNKVVRGAK
jgi:hypothetical protein